MHSCFYTFRYVKNEEELKNEQKANVKNKLTAQKKRNSTKVTLLKHLNSSTTLWTWRHEQNDT